MAHCLPVVSKYLNVCVWRKGGLEVVVEAPGGFDVVAVVCVDIQVTKDDNGNRDGESRSEPSFTTFSE